MFFLFEISLPAFIYLTYYFINETYISSQFYKFDKNNDGIFSEDEQIDDFQKWSEIYYGDGGRNTFCLIFIFASLIFGLLYKIIFFFGKKIKTFLINKIEQNN